MSNATAAPTTVLPPQHKTEAGKFGSGTYANISLGLYNILISCSGRFSKALAHKIACDYAADWVRGAQSDMEIKSKVGKIKADSKEAKMTSSGMKTAKQIASNSMFIARLVQTLDSLKTEGVITKRAFPPDNVLPDFVQEYLTKSEEWVKAQQWED